MTILGDVLGKDPLKTALVGQVPSQTIGAGVAMKPQPLSESLQHAFDLGTVTLTPAANGSIEIDSVGKDGLPFPDSPTVAVAASDAWLKYGLSINVTAASKTSIPIPFLSASASGSAGISLSMTDFHVHATGDQAKDKVASDLGSLRTVLSQADVLALLPKEAVSLQTGWQLAANISLSWSDVFSTNLSAFSSFFPGGTLPSIELSAGASLSADVSFSDQLELSFVRAQTGSLLAVFHKTTGNSLKLTPQISVSIGLGSVDTALTSFLDALLGKLPGAASLVANFEALLQKLDAGASTLTAAMAPLSQLEKTALTAGLVRLGLGSSTNAATLSAAWQQLVQHAHDLLVQAAQTKLQLGFQYEYSRVASHEALATILINDSALAPLHPLLVKGQLDQVFAQIAASSSGSLPQAKLISFLGRDTTTWEQSWGFTLGFGNWKLGGKDDVKLESVVETNAPGPGAPQHVSYLGSRGYTADLGTTSFDVGGDFDFETNGFIANPTAADLTLGLHLSLTAQSGSSNDEIANLLDQACVFGAIGETDFANVRSSIQTLAQGTGISATVQLKVSDAQLRGMIKVLALEELHHVLPNDVAATALARALPVASGISIRATPSSREQFYGLVFRKYLQDVSAFNNQPLNYVLAVLKAVGAPQTDLNAEQGWNPLGIDTTFMGILTVDSTSASLNRYAGLSEKWQRATAAWSSLSNAIDNKGDLAIVETLFPDLALMWSSPYCVRTFAGIVIALATPDQFAAIERTLTVSRQDKKGSTLVFGGMKKS